MICDLREENIGREVECRGAGEIPRVHSLTH